MKNDVLKDLGLRPDQARGQDAQVDASVKEKGLEPRKVKERIRRYKAKMAIKTYYGFDYHKKLCHLIGQVVNYRKMAPIISITHNL